MRYTGDTARLGGCGRRSGGELLCLLLQAADLLPLRRLQLRVRRIQRLVLQGSRGDTSGGQDRADKSERQWKTQGRAMCR